ncbi:MAG: STAS domain-containing protein [Chthoniobacterales bacterium]|nr:STAS domain-containing protein [Chthoniobacterales bacterium]
MQCTFDIEGDALIACPAGRIDTTTYNDFKTALHAKLDETKAKHLVIDLTDLEYVSSAGFREFFLAGRRMGRDGGTLSVCSFQPQVKELFEIAQFMTAYGVHDTREAAIAAAKQA